MIKKDVFEGTLKNPLEYWGTKDRNEVRELLGTEVAAMVGYNQRNPHHCYDLFMHILHTVDELDTNSQYFLKQLLFFTISESPKLLRKRKTVWCLRAR